MGRGRTFVYVGNWIAKFGETDGRTHGIGVYEYGSEDGSLRYVRNVFEEFCIGGMYMDRKKDILYVTDEREHLPGMRSGGGGRVAALKADADTGELTMLNCVPSLGVNPVYCTTDPTSSYLLAANHGSRATVTVTETGADGRITLKALHDESSIVLFSLNGDGSIGEAADLLRLTGEGPGQDYQLSPHAHSVVCSPDGDMYVVCDKGSDRIFTLRIDTENGRLIPIAGGSCECAPASAPRYSVFHPTQPYVFADKEYRAVVSMFRLSRDGALTRVCTAASLPDYLEEPVGSTQSDICIDRDGAHLYVLLRRINVITVFEVDTESESLRRIQTLEGVPDGGRGCAISPDGRFLIVAFLTGGTVESFPIEEGGRLGEAVTGQHQPAPGSVVFLYHE